MRTQATKSQYHSPPENSPYSDQGRLHALQVMLCLRIDDVLAALGVTLYKSKKLYHGCCPVHGGSNPGALNLYPDGESRPGYWVCNTRGCENTFKKTVIGFVRGVLSQQKYGWGCGKPGQVQRTAGWKEAVDWCCAFLGTDIGKVQVDNVEVEKRRFAAGVASLTRAPQPERSGITRSVVRKHLQIPSAYFVERGWSAEVLDKYDVGFYPGRIDKQEKPHALADRVAVPIYDQDHKFAIGFTGRSVFPKCANCGRWHHPEEACPVKGDGAAWVRTAKWRNHNFDKDSCLYNLWFAKKAIRETGTVVLVEGAGECWRCVESSVHNAVAMLGVHLSDEQQILLEMSGALNVVVLTNSDQAGDRAKNELKKRLGRSFRLHFPVIKTNDLGEMTAPQVKEEVSPLLDQLAQRKY